MNIASNLYRESIKHLTEKSFLKRIEMSESEIKRILERGNFEESIKNLHSTACLKDRFSVYKVVESMLPILSLMGPDEVPKQHLKNAYNYVLRILFPEKIAASGDELISQIEEGTRQSLFLLQLMQSIFKVEEQSADFDPTVDFHFVSADEIKEKGYNKEYLRLRDFSKEQYIYEFMRIGVELTPYNTLGHIAGVHYVAMHAARQLEALKIPVDLGIISGAAAGHDIGKYGCKKSEERRIPYLHYYYTDICFNRFKMPMIGHIAANHSTWDLELANLSVESLLLIYADFRVKSSRNSEGAEVVHFYSLDDAFQVILDKLDNVDEAKEHRYRRVYNKLKDFEDYMINLGVDTSLPEVPAKEPPVPIAREKMEVALASGNEIAREYKYEAIDHNIRLMNRFNKEEEFGSILETARSEQDWKSLRTYISILGQYSTYMTERQKQMTLRFLNEFLVHKESDIRNQAAEIIGQIIAHFNEEYRKELPAGVNVPQKKITNMSLWENTLETLLKPDHKMTDQHKKWLSNSLKSVTKGLLMSCRPEKRGDYLDVLMKYYRQIDMMENNTSTLLQAALKIEPGFCSEYHIDAILKFAEYAEKNGTVGIKLAAIGVKDHFGKCRDYHKEIKLCLGHDPDVSLSEEDLSEMYLDNLKASTPWTIKVANIKLMLKSIEKGHNGGELLHVATHLANLVKVSETVIVRQAAGNGLIEIIKLMPLEQRNEIAVELGKGLEIGDYQFTKYIPIYLGVIMLHLPPRELDELIQDLEELLVASNGQVAGAVLNTFGVLIENYNIYRQLFGEDEEEAVTKTRKYRIINSIVRGFANYNTTVSQEAFWTIGLNIFGSEKLSKDEKYEIYSHCGKKIMTLCEGSEERDLDFFYNAAVFNKIYGFISDYELEMGQLNVVQPKAVAFFPGTFDPFSVSHKAIAREIRDMGCEVYLALDEFSWSKKTQPRLQRRKIMSMSIADEENMYIFPDRMPVNIANPKDLAMLKALFTERELYFVAGSDVIENASCYRAEPVDDSIHTLNHIIFRRYAEGKKGEEAFRQSKAYTSIQGKIMNLTLAADFEEISSTRIRENIDMNRDISNLIDPVAQNYIYESSLYLREPAYKHIFQAQEIKLEEFKARGSSAIDGMEDELRERGHDVNAIRAYLEKENVYTVVLRDELQRNRVVAVAAVNKLDSVDFLETFKDQEIAAYIRSKAAGGIAVIGGIYTSRNSSIGDLRQTILVEILSELLARDYTYVVYNSCEETGIRKDILKALKKQGFVNIAPAGSKPIYAAEMHSPVIVFKNVNTIIKSPLNKQPLVLKAVEEAHNRLLAVLTRIYPGEVILSYNSGIMLYKMMNLIAKINCVPPVPLKEKSYGKSMVVPFGKVLQGVAVPNTVTKALHTEKYFNRDISAFSVEESSFYSTLETQVRTIKSFNRPVILVDDLVNKGYRMKKIDPLLKKTGVGVVDTVVGVQTGRGRDLMTMMQRTVSSAYFLPNMKCWIDENAIYPYIGGDSMKDEEKSVASLGNIPSLNMILPFAVPSFLGDISGSHIYDYSMTCLENARNILKALEEEYQNVFERKLTIKRLGEVITEPKLPDLGEHVKYDDNVAASSYIEKDMERLIRMRKLFR